MWRVKAHDLTIPPTTDALKDRAVGIRYCSDELNKLISDTEDEMGMEDYGLCDGCGLPIEPTKTFHGDRCIKIYAKAHAKAHGKEDEDGD